MLSSFDHLKLFRISDFEFGFAICYTWRSLRLRDDLFSDSVLNSVSLSNILVGLFYQSGFLGDLFHGSMLLAYFSEKFLWRRVILDYA